MIDTTLHALTWIALGVGIVVVIGFFRSRDD
jgi:hypothetical protein